VKIGIPLVLIVACACVFEKSIAQETPIYRYSKHVGGSGNDAGYAMTLTSAGDMLITGYFQGTVDFDPSGTASFTLNASQEEVYVAKYDANGNFLWAKSFKGSTAGRGLSIATDNTGNILVTGEFQGTADFDPGAATFNLSSHGARDIFLAKLDANGNFIWAGSMGNINDDYGYSIKTDGSGNVYIGGDFRGFVDFNPGPGTFNLTSTGPSGRSDPFVLKLDASGNFLWAKNFGTTIDDFGLGLALDPSGNPLIVGKVRGDFDADPGPGITTLTGYGGDDVVIVKLDASGNFVWGKNMGGTGMDQGFAITTDASGNVYSTGLFSGTADFDPGAGTFNLVAQAFYTEVFVSKLDANGNFVWAKRFGGPTTTGGLVETQGRAIVLDGSGNVYTVGDFSDTMDFDPGTGTFNLTSAAPSGRSDAFVSKLDNSGNFVWAYRVGGGQNDSGRALAVTPTGDVLTTGFFLSNAHFNPGTCLSNVFSNGGTDMYILRTSTVSTPAAPTITSVSPSSGAPGATVTISGTNFSTTPENNLVRFGGGIFATVTASTTTTITTTVPAGASNGTISVIIGCNTATSSASFLISANIIPPYIPTSGLVAYYGFPSVALDATTNHNDGTLFGPTSVDDRRQSTNKAFSFDGVNDYIKVNDSPTLRVTDLTISGWFKFNSTSGLQLMVDKHVGSSNSDSYEIWYELGKIWGVVGNTGGLGPTVSAPFTPVAGDWYNVAYTFNDATNTQSLYIDGCLVAQNSTSMSPAYDSEPLLIGASNDFTTPQLFFNGTIDDVAIWNRELSITEIRNAIGSYLSGEGINPMSGPVGTVVTLYVDGYSLLPSNNIITFNGVPATVITTSASTVTAQVPVGATTGPVVIQRGCMTYSDSDFTVTGSSCLPVAERASLIAIYDAFNGDSWNDNTNWKNGGDESTWHGVTITGCRVTGLDLQANNLDGELPQEIGDLTQLVDLNLSQNNIYGSIPPEIGLLINVKHLRLEQNQLTGQIPTEVGNMTWLTLFDVSNNQLGGDLPASMSALTHISQVHIHYNSIVNIPVMPALFAYTTDNNALTFEDIEPNIPVGHYDFEYNPQAEIPPGGNIYLSPGDALNIPFSTGGTANSYQWYKDGGPITGQTSSNLSIPSVTIADGGVYQVLITNSIAPDLTLASRIYNVDVTDLCGPRVDGVLDPTFNAKVDYAVGFSGMELQSDGKIITYLPYVSIDGSMYPYNGVYRFNPDGSMDGSFNSNSETPIYHQLVVQSDDEFLIGSFETVNRYNADGSVDATFVSPLYPAAYFNAIALQSDGKVLVSVNDNSIGEDIIARLNADGSVDPSFNAPYGYPATVIVQQPDGKILVGGYFTGGIIRLDASGAIDATFNTGSGIGSGGGGNVADIALQSDGKIIAVGYFGSYNGTPHENIVRLNSDGSLDNTFTLVAAGSPDDSIQAVKILSNGKIMVGGGFYRIGGRSRTNLARLNTDGTVDCAFTLGTGTDGRIYDIEIQPDKKILIQGSFAVYDGAAPNGFARINNSASVPTITITLQPKDVTACGEVVVNFSTNATGTTNITYQWQYSPNSGPLSFTDISNDIVYSGATTATLSIDGPGLSYEGRYRCRINGDGAAQVFTDDEGLFVNPPPADPGVIGNTGCQLTSIVLTATGTTNGKYRWYTVSSGGTAIAGEVNSTYATPPLTTTTTYYVAINTGSCESSRIAVTATVNPLPAAPIVTPGSGCLPSATVSLSASGGTAGQYRWYTVPTGGTPIAGVTGPTHSPVISATTQFYVSIHNGLCESNRTVVTATIKSCTPTITTSPLSTQIGGQVTLNIAPLVSTVLNAIDINSIRVTKQPVSGAVATVTLGVLSVNYTGISFAGKDVLTLEACDLAAHCASEDFTIDVAGEITVYNALSPNGDGKNEVFYIQHIDVLPDTKNNKVSIFDRWGNAVFEVDNYDNATRVFRGFASNGTELPNGVYFYELVLVASGEKRTGYISLRR
jgi:gliding motility-associated-like protein/uncharacterized delta-60 repeat protein